VEAVYLSGAARRDESICEILSNQALRTFRRRSVPAASRAHGDDRLADLERHASHRGKGDRLAICPPQRLGTRRPVTASEDSARGVHGAVAAVHHVHVGEGRSVLNQSRGGTTKATRSL